MAESKIVSKMRQAINGSSQNGAHHKEPSGLTIIIIGAGIGGLTAAIGLRQQGHNVKLFEQSQFATELGAAVHLAPNANGVLHKIGIRAEGFGANEMLHLTEFDSNGKLEKYVDLAGPNKLWQHPWLLAHRVHLHEALKKAATSPEGKGSPAELHLCSKVTDIDTKNAKITLKDGTTVEGDMIIGADGVHSAARKQLAKDLKPHPSGKSAFRFLIPKQIVLDDPELSNLFEKNGELLIWFASDRRIVIYPTTNNTLLNFVCIHPDSESEGGEGWNTGASLDKLLGVYQDFDPRVLAVLAKADIPSLKVWRLLDMEILPSWIDERLALLGDAAHPFLPHQGQGAACAIEDAVSLSVVFPQDAPRNEIVERLKLYEKIRYERANRIQEFSRLAGADISDEVKVNMQAYTVYNFGHDEFDNSTQELRKWTWARNPASYWRMPVAFGPMPGPRQSSSGISRQATHSTFTTASIKFKTSRTLLQNLFPPNSTSYKFKSPGTVAYASFTQTTLDKMEWLGGSGYNHIGLYIHGVQYVKKNGDVINGTYMPILFENLADPIVSGREELGMPKLYASIDVFQRDNSYRISTGWQGAQWGSFTLEGLQEADPSSAVGSVSGEDDEGIFAYKYIPKVGRSTKGEAESEYPTFVPFAEDEPKPVVNKVRYATSANVKIDALDWEALPTLFHVISRLQEVPVYEVVSAKVVSGLGIPDVSAARRIE